MILLAGIVPPPKALYDALDALRLALPSVRPTTRPAARGVGHRVGHRPRDVSTSVLDECEMFVRLGRFGKVTPGDRRRLADALAGATVEWEQPSLFVSGAEMRPAGGGVVVMAQLQGDVDTLVSIARSLNRAAHGVGFLLDRRNFRAEIPIATISADDPLSARRVARVLAGRPALDWRAEHVALLREAQDDTPPRYQVLERLPLAGA